MEREAWDLKTVQLVLLLPADESAVCWQAEAVRKLPRDAYDNEAGQECTGPT